MYRGMPIRRLFLCLVFIALLAVPAIAATAAHRDTSAPSVPTLLRVATASPTSVSLTWKASRDNVRVAAYGVYRGSTLVATTKNTSAKVVNLLCGTSYTFAVNARDVAGNTSAKATLVTSTAPCPALTTTSTAAGSSVQTAPPPTALAAVAAVATAGSAPSAGAAAPAAAPADSTAPTAPGSPVVTSATTSQIAISWTASTDNVGVTGYRTYLDGVAVGTPTATSYTFTGLTCGTSHRLGVDARDLAGNASSQSSVVASTPACGDTSAPSMPSGLGATSISQTGFTFTWSASTDNVAVAGYNVYRNGSLLGPTGGTAYAMSGLSCGTSYTLGVEARDTSGNISARATKSVSTTACSTTPPPSSPTPPPPPPPAPPASTGFAVSVAVGGSDAACSRGGSACASLNQAYQLAQPGDTIQVASGTYPSQQILQNGRTGAQVTIVCAGTCTINGDLVLGQNNGSPSGNAPSNLTIDGINIHGTLFGWYADNTGQSAPSTGFVYQNAHVWDTQNGGRGIYLYSFKNATIRNVEVGPLCCDSDGIDLAIPRPGAPSPNGITLDTVNVHDVYDSCALLLAQLPGTPCSGSGYESGCSSCEHPDATQWYGGLNSTIRNSSFTNINPGGAAGQGIFLAAANGGTFSNLTITGNTLGGTPNNDLSISGPGQNTVTGFTNISGNTVHGNIRLYGDTASTAPFAAGVQVTVANNTADLYQTTDGNGCNLVLGDGTTYRPAYSGNTFANHQCENS
jgi:chitodextrinase